jgi:hypothetical protein
MYDRVRSLAQEIELWLSLAVNGWLLWTFAKRSAATLPFLGLAETALALAVLTIWLMPLWIIPAIFYPALLDYFYWWMAAEYVLGAFSGVLLFCEHRRRLISN